MADRSPVIWGIEVNEVKVLTYGGSDATRWTLWRSRFEPLGRVIPLAIGMLGDTAFAACTSREEADETAASWHESGMVHKSATKVRQIKPSDVSAEHWTALTDCLERLGALVGEV